LNRCDRVAAIRETNVKGIVPSSETYKAEFSSAASAGHMTTSSNMAEEQAAFRTSSNAGTALNVADSDRIFRRSYTQDLDPWVLSIASEVSAVFQISAVPLPLAGPAEIVRSACGSSARWTLQTYITGLEWGAPGITSGTLLVVTTLSDVILRHFLLDCRSRLVVKARHMANEEKLPDLSAVWMRTGKTVPAILYSALTVFFH